SKIPCEADAGGLAFVLRSIAEAAAGAGAKSISIAIPEPGACEIIISDDRPMRAAAVEISEQFQPVFSKSRGLSPIMGLGLKLPLARKIIELHGGRIEIPEQSGEKTEIRILLGQSA